MRSEHFFQDSAISPKLLVKAARRRNLDAIALTDHDNMKGIPPFLRYASKFDDIIPIVGQEITKYDQNRKGWAHILTYGLREIPWKIRFQPLPEFLEYMEENNAVCVLAHPFDLSQSAPAGGFDRETYAINFSILKRIRMVESVNGLQSKRHNYLAQIVARELKIPGIAGGDSHQPKMIGRCFTYLEGSTEEEILENLRQIKKSPSKYRVRTNGTGSTHQIWAEWFFFLLSNFEFDLRYDIYHQLNPHKKKRYRNPVYDREFSEIPMFSKILLQAALPYAFWGIMAGLKIWAPRMEKQTKKKELKVLKSLVDYQALQENNDTHPLELPFSKEEIALLQQR
ncbi:MAG: PHP domain-containing protein [Candidatus Hodarchaeales archaeon]